MNWKRMKMVRVFGVGGASRIGSVDSITGGIFEETAGMAGGNVTTVNVNVYILPSMAQ